MSEPNISSKEIIEKDIAEAWNWLIEKVRASGGDPSPYVRDKEIALAMAEELAFEWSLWRNDLRRRTFSKSASCYGMGPAAIFPTITLLFVRKGWRKAAEWIDHPERQRGSVQPEKFRFAFAEGDAGTQARIALDNRRRREERLRREEKEARESREWAERGAFARRSSAWTEQNIRERVALAHSVPEPLERLYVDNGMGPRDVRFAEPRMPDHAANHGQRPDTCGLVLEVLAAPAAIVGGLISELLP